MRSVLFSSLAAACLAVGVSATTVASPPRISDATRNAADLAGEVTLCGSVGDYLAPSSTADGSITVSGVTAAGGPSPFVIAAGTPVASGDGARLMALSATGSFTCVKVTIAASGTITALSIAITAAFDFGWVDRVGGNYRLWPSGSPEVYTHLTDEAADIVAADLDLDSFLGWFARPEGRDLGLGTVTFSMAADGSLARMSIDGREMICGEVGDVSEDPQTSIFEMGNGMTRPESILLAGIELPTDLLTDASLGVMELAYVEQQYTNPAEADPICVVAVIVDTQLVELALESGAPRVCGRQWMHAIIGEGISEAANIPAWTVIFPDKLVGYSTDGIATENIPNLTRLWVLAPGPGFPQPGFCAEADLRSGSMSLVMTVSATVLDRSDNEIQLSIGDQGFILTPGSQVDPTLVPGTTACIEITAHSGLQGPVVMRAVAACDGSPDSAMAAGGFTGREAASVAGLLLLSVSLWLFLRRVPERQ